MVVNFPIQRHFKPKTISIDYLSSRLSTVKILAQTVELFLSNDAKLVPYKHENQIIILSFLSSFLNMSRKEKTTWVC